MQDSTLALLHEFRDRDADATDAALLVNRCLVETLDLADLESRLLGLAGRFGGHEEPWDFLRQEGFGILQPADVPAGSRLDEVLESGRGLPITLGVLLVYLSKQSERDAVGINFPGHFLVRVGDSLVDPLSMTERSEADCLAALPEEARNAALFSEADPSTILLRMFNNLKYHYAGRAEFHRALDMVDCQLCVLPDSPGLLFEQGEFWLRLGSVQGAKLAFDRVIAADDPKLASLARRRRADLSGRSDTLH